VINASRLLLLFCTFTVLLLPACGGTWIDDEQNFERVFGFDKPQDVQVLQSYYWKSSHWSTEYRYYISIRSSSEFAKGLTTAESVRPSVVEESALDSCFGNRPSWFAPKPLNRYEMWVSKVSHSYRVLRDKDEGILYVCDEQL
jgi:hypothetical protein